ncbi:sigma-70 family RNA polymerase sigma factor [Cyclobacterium sp. 1_MG-2023]|uniref:RNA polymerase sigma factor n=1 Tax=Cyclobacterium sp. 1_MG-2023 TaxID=3062681 RepID=UPI0026E26B9D|nr:sigma-70 family RNA polymerase sigma factor [Cyclobacterium sp. 1_MG-2023]MDO6438990.1 sigma-70 family RNA polymerase sigma factor [Cyclobacterium sp. 1_MG-2023]
MNPLRRNTPSMEPNYYWDLLMQGHRSGLEGLYRLFAATLFSYGQALTKNEDFLQDCIQEVFIDLWKYHQSLGKADHVKAYLLRALSHKIYKENRNKIKKNSVNWNDSLDNSFAIESIESELISVQQERGLQIKLAEGLDRLPTRQKEVINLLFFEQLSYQEVSKFMGINLRSVYTLAWKAIGNLKKYIVSLFFNTALAIIFQVF